MKNRHKIENLTYLCLLLLALGFAYFAHGLAVETLNTIILGMASSIFTTVLLFFFIKRFIVPNETHKKRKVSVVLCHGGEQLDWPIQIPFSQFSRYEVMGRLGMIPMKTKGQRFAIDHTGHQAFFDEIYRISENTEDEILVLKIPCTQKELQQFDAKIKN